MAEISVLDGSWSFDGDVLRIVPGGGAHEVRRAVGGLEIPLAAIAGAAFEPARKGGHLRVWLRRGADPLTDVARGGLTGAADPYRLAVPRESTGVAEYLADEIRDMLRLAQVPAGPCDEFLLPGPDVPITASAGDGTVTFDGDVIRIEWNSFARTAKRAVGPQEFSLSELTGVVWTPMTGLGYGSLRFRVRSARATAAPEEDPHCVAWGIQRYGGTTVLVAAAVYARLRGRTAPPALPEGTGGGKEDLVTRLVRLAELHRSGALTDEEFQMAKRLVLREAAEEA